MVLLQNKIHQIYELKFWLQSNIIIHISRGSFRFYTKISTPCILHVQLKASIFN